MGVRVELMWYTVRTASEAEGQMLTSCITVVSHIPETLLC